jgi:tetratricopeptide (TPR) repeat protein
MSKNRRRSPFDVTTSRSGRGYRIFVIAMALFLVVGSVALIVGSALESRSGQESGSLDDRPGEEVARLQTAVSDDPDDYGSMAVIANILANSGRVDESIVWYERAIVGDPDNGDLRLAFGLALFQLGNDFDAELQLRRAHEAMPDIASPLFYLGQLNERRAVPDLDAAMAYYRQAIEIAPDSIVGQQAQERLEDLESPSSTPTP